VPELPEVETIVRGIRPRLVGRRITGVAVLDPKILQNISPDKLEEKITGRVFCNVARRGKYLIFGFAQGGCLILHLRMTGQAIVSDPDVPREKHLRFCLRLSDGKELRLVDLRRFATLHWVPAGMRARDCATGGFVDLGCEPLSRSFTLDRLKALLGRRTTQIKAFLLDQRHLAGLGNIYADEVLHRAGIHPQTRVCDLSEESIEALYRSIQTVLNEGILHRGTSVSDYVDGSGQPGEYQKLLRVYGREGEPCRSCGTLIARTKVGGRGTYFCPQCQRERS